MLKKNNIKVISMLIIFMIISLLSISSSMLYTNIDNILFKQLIFFIIGFMIIAIIYYNPIHIRTTGIYFYIFNLILLLITLSFGKAINGSKCWINIPILGSFQPSEFMKISLILTTSSIIYNHTYKNTFKSDLYLLIKLALVYIPPIILTFLEPDTGAIIMYLVIFISMLISSPLRKRWLIILSIISLILISIFFYLYYFQKDLFTNIFTETIYYRIKRILDWHHGTSMQLENAKAAIGSSGLFGYGYKKTPIYFPESSTDFIFAVIASNFGLIGSLILIILLFLFDKSLLDIAKSIKIIKNKYIIIGTVSILLYQQFQNIGMNLEILPITGITLPFISYGGSSLLSYFLIIAIILKKEKSNFYS